MHLNLLEKQEQAKPKSSRWKEIIKLRAKKITKGKLKEYKESMK
jgi:hypothetical protein